MGPDPWVFPGAERHGGELSRAIGSVYLAAQRRRRCAPLTLKATAHTLRSAQGWLDENAFAGLRFGEVAGLTWREVDFWNTCWPRSAASALVPRRSAALSGR